MNQLTRVEVNQFATLLLVIRDDCMRQPLEAGPEPALRLARPAGHAAKLTLVPSKEANDEVGFAKRPGSKDEAFAQASGHSAERFKVLGYHESARHIYVSCYDRTKGDMKRTTVRLNEDLLREAKKVA